ncbi:diguanylate cyclase [Lacticaseibacillus jixiensis]|uniref:diguanylate cyclase n=1 Tax=Lacticaseibacillus jixiensis TaxID=3231926 RepID=UPI0036F362C8
MNAHTLPLPWPMYLAQALIVVLVTMGFVTYQTRTWQLAVALPRNSWRGRWRRFWVPGLAIALAGLLFVDGNGQSMPQTGLTFNALAVFILTFVMFDNDISLLEYLCRGAMLIGIGGMYYRGHYAELGFLTVICFCAVWFAVIWWLGHAIRYNIFRHILAIFSIAVMFWLTVPEYTVGIHFTPAVKLQAIGLSAVAIVVSGVYLHDVHVDAVRNARARHNATYDALTNALTFARYQRDIAEAFTTAKNGADELAIIALDVDYFKVINDQYGHLVGNDVLTALAKRLQAQLADDARLYRTGGEEFAIIAQHADEQAALALARQCWQAIREAPLISGQYQIQCTISCGVTNLRHSDQDVQQLLKRADTNLYQSKQRGRDTITMAGQAATTTRPERAMETYSYFTQRIVDLNQNLAVIANEVKLAHYQRADETWEVVTHPQPLAVKLPFLKEATRMNPDERMSLYLALDEFYDPQITKQLAAFMQGDAVPKLLWLNLTSLPDPKQLAVCMQRYQKLDIRVLLEVADFKHNAAKISKLLPQIDGLKLTLADLREAFADDQAAEAGMVAWYQRCRANHTDVIFAGIENSVDAAYVSDVLHGHFAQGDIFDRPELPRLA